MAFNQEKEKKEMQTGQLKTSGFLKYIQRPAPRDHRQMSIVDPEAIRFLIYKERHL